MRLGEILRAWRIHRELNLRHVAKLMGISASTLSRIENGLACDGRTLATILTWLMEQPK